MRKLTVNAFMTLDGVVQAPGGPQEDTRGGFRHGGWSAGYWDDALGAQMGDWMGRPFDLLLGRRTYEIFAAHWPRVADDDPGGSVLNNARKYVASRTLREVTWQNSVLLQGDVAQAVARLKQEEGPEIQVHGSGNLVQTLLTHDLVDEWRLLIYPVLLGTGLRLFGDGTVPAGLELLGTTTSASGVIIATYGRAGEIRYGSFALEEAPAG